MRLPYFLVTFVSVWAINSWNVAVTFHSPNGILLHWNSPSSQAKPVFSRSCFPGGHLPERRAEIRCREEFRVSQLGEALIDTGTRVSLVSLPRSRNGNHKKIQVDPFLLALPTPQAHGDFDGSIMSYSINVSISFLHASGFCGVILLAPSL